MAQQRSGERSFPKRRSEALTLNGGEIWDEPYTEQAMFLDFEEYVDR